MSSAGPDGVPGPFQTILCEAVADGVVQITLNRPDRGNGVVPELVSDLLTALDELERDFSVRALVLTGAYNDGHARYAPGEISRAEPGFLHAPRAEPGELCYLMLISFGPARFTGQFGLMQRLTGFPWQPKVDETP